MKAKTYLFRSIPSDLWRKFKMLCAQQDITIRDKLIELIKKEIS